jgi:Uma2 family endonuclease
MTSIIPDPLPLTQPPAPAYDLADIPYPNLDDLITEDGAPVDSLFAEKQYRLLTEPLYTSWTPPGEDRRFIVATDVGVFYQDRQPPLVPDCFLALGVAPGANLQAKENHSYFVWLHGKAPDIVIEIVSDKRGGEEDYKKEAYARMGVLFYVIFDPRNLLEGGVLRAGVLNRRDYAPLDPPWFPEIGVGLTLWQGAFEGFTDTWLRWCDENGRVIPTGAERAERLAAQLRALGVNPEV